MQAKSSRSIKTLSIITILFILYIIFSLIIFKKDVFLYRGSISAGEVPIGLGFIIILLFNCISAIWIIITRKLLFNNSSIMGILLTFCALCIILLPVDKVLIDEIAKQYAENFSVTGEFIMLYSSLLIQLIYTSLILRYSLKR